MYCRPCEEVMHVVDWASDYPVGRYVTYRCDDCGVEDEVYEYQE